MIVRVAGSRGFAMGCSPYGDEDELVMAEMRHSYLGGIREEYRRRTALRMISGGAAGSVAELFGQARAEHTERLFAEAAVEALFLGVTGCG